MDDLEWEVKPVAPRTVCADGTSLSIQGSAFHYSLPRTNQGPYTHVEVGFIKGADHKYIPAPESWLEFADDGTLESDVFGYVPIELVEAFIESHGGRAA